MDSQINQDPIDIDNPLIDNTEDNSTYFKPIGSSKKAKQVKLKPVLPKWIKNSHKFSADIDSNCCGINEFESIIDARLMENLRKNDIKKFFPVQKKVIPKLIKSLKIKRYVRPQDVYIISPTGSGKTFAYAIPIINYLINRVVTQIRAMVILPVNDLAKQVFQVFKSLCQNTTLRVGLASGSSKNGEETFYKPSGSGTLCLVDILIATPGKLMDLIQKSNGFHLKNLEILIIDEADRMMSETQFEWLKIIESSTSNPDVQSDCSCINLNVGSLKDLKPFCICPLLNISKESLFKILFSATFTPDPEKIDSLSLYHPLMINAISSDDKTDTASETKQTIPEDLKEMMIITDKDKKPLVLWHLVKNCNYKRILCFTNSIFNAHRLYKLMKQMPDSIVREFHSKQNISIRTKLLKKFERGRIDLLISTDMTSRGMDIHGIDYVICYDLPRNETAYIHRIGRTARAGKGGNAISLLSPDELKHFNIISRRAHKSSTNKHVERLVIKNSELKNLMPIYEKALQNLKKDTIREQRKAFINKHQQIKTKDQN